MLFLPICKPPRRRVTPRDKSRGRALRLLPAQGISTWQSTGYPSAWTCAYVLFSVGVSPPPMARIARGATPAGQVAPMGRRLNAAPVEEKNSRPRGNPRRGRELSFTTARAKRAARGANCPGCNPRGTSRALGRRLNAAPVEEKSSRPRGNPRRGRAFTPTTARAQRAALGATRPGCNPRGTSRGGVRFAYSQRRE